MCVCVWILTVAIAFGVGTFPQTASAKGEVQASEAIEPVQHRIVQIKDLIEDFDESEWTAITENSGKFGANIGGVERAKKGQVTGYFNQVGKFVDDENATRDVIQLNALAAGKEGVEEIRGTYSLILPEFKRIQLEIEYEEPYVDGKETFDEYYVEVSERNKLNPDEWVESGTLKRSDRLKALKPHVLDSKKEKYALRTFVANLSEWAGREIHLDLVTKNSSDRTEGYKGRWTKLRMVGSTFDYRFLAFDENEETPVNTQNKTMRLMSNRPMYTVSISPASGYISIPDLASYADTGPAPAYINNRWIAYFNSGYKWDVWHKDLAEGEANTGTMAFDFVNSSCNPSQIIGAVANSTLLRGDPPSPSSATSIEPYAVIAPYRPSNPSSDFGWKFDWENGYTGVNAAFVATESGITRVHAFLHVEDWYKHTEVADILDDPISGINDDPTTDYILDYNYSRIGYARSSNNQAYPLQWQRCGSDISSATLGNASPIIECFQREWTTHERGMAGSAGPVVIINPINNYAYLFYSRYVSKDWITNPTPANPITNTTFTIEEIEAVKAPTVGGKWVTTCVARAWVQEIISNDYENYNYSSPWKKFYNGCWTHLYDENRGLNGLSTAITERNENRIVCSIMYNTYLNAYLMMCNDDSDIFLGLPFKSYLYTCTNFETQNWGTGLLLDNAEIGNQHGIRLVGTDGDDKTGGQTMSIFTRDIDDDGFGFYRRILVLYR